MLRLALKPSRWLATALISAHASAALTLAPLDVPRWVQVAVALAIGISLTRALWRHALLRSRGAFLGLELGRDGTVAVLTTDGEWRDVLLLDSTYVSPLLTVLNLRMPGRRFACHVLLVPDSCEADAFRRLRVWLRWGYSGAAAQAAKRSSEERASKFFSS